MEVLRNEGGVDRSELIFSEYEQSGIQEDFPYQ